MIDLRAAGDLFPTVLKAARAGDLGALSPRWSLETTRGELPVGEVVNRLKLAVALSH
jgi:hypothetical protein